MTKLIIGLSFLLLFSALANPDYWNRINSIFRKGDTGSGRTVVWKRSFKMLPEYAIIGSGPGTFSSAYGRMLKAGKFKTVGVPHYDLGWKSAHNSYILVMIELGLPGLFIFLGLIYVILFGLRRIRKLFKLVKPDADALIMANIIEISFLTFLFCAIFLSLAYSPVFVTLMSAGLLVRKIAYHELADFEAIPQTDLPHPDDNSYSR